MFTRVKQTIRSIILERKKYIPTLF